LYHLFPKKLLSSYFSFLNPNAELSVRAEAAQFIASAGAIDPGSIKITKDF
jgi:hypothetical protein